MTGFVDETIIEVSSGNGGNGAVSFRREKYVPKGGPDGGDGGKGGDVVFQVKTNTKTLVSLRARYSFKAKNGQGGMGRRKHGKNGEDVIIAVPPGTLIKDPETGAIIKDLTGVESFTFLKGGWGGKGNWHFKTSTRQTPRFAKDGKPGETRKLLLELNIIADIGFVGFPNAGKSTLLSILTNANPKIGSYAFTTKTPNLGLLKYHDEDIVLADIPGLIEGAHTGNGLGIRFLKHISRTKGLVFLIDLSSDNVENEFSILLNELREFSSALCEKPRLILGTKCDIVPDDSDPLKRLQEKYPDEEIHEISSFSRKGIEALPAIFSSLRKKDSQE